MKNLVKIFFQAEGTRPWAVLACLVVAAFVEGLGIAALLPLLALVDQSSSLANNEIADFMRQTLEAAGLALNFGTLLIVFVVMITAKSVSTIFAGIYVGYAVAELTTRLRLRLVRGLLRADWQYLTGQSGGRWSNAFSYEAHEASQAYRMAAEIFQSAVIASVYLIGAFLVTPDLAFLAMLIGSGIVAALWFLVRMARRAGKRQTKSIRHLVMLVGELLHSLKTIRIMGRERDFSDLFGYRANKLRTALRQMYASNALLAGMQELVTGLAIALFVFLAVTVWASSVIDVVFLGVILLRIVKVVNKMQRNYQRAIQMEAPYLSLEKLFREAGEAVEQYAGTRAPTFESSITLDDVDFSYPAKAVLKNASLTIDKGAMVCLLGPSGAGKTTLSDLVSGLQMPSKGRILVDSQPLTEIDLHLWRRQIGYVPQDIVLLNDSVLTNVSLGSQEISEGDAVRALKMAGAWSFVRELPEGIHTSVGERGDRLSGGQRQRVAIARALAHRPQLLILDEATSALDGPTERDIWQVLRENSEGLTIIAITHRRDLARLADLTVEISDGSLSAWTGQEPGSGLASLPV